MLRRRDVLAGAGAALAADPALAGKYSLRGKKGRPAESSNGTANGPKFFVMAPWLPEPSDMVTWKNRGMNVALANKDDDFWAAGTWRAAALAAGLKLMVSPLHNGGPSTVLADNADANVVAYAIHDEPNLVESATSFQAEVDAIVNSGAAKPIFYNLTSHWPSFEYTTPDNGLPYLNISNAPWRCQDLYAPQGDPPFWIGDYTFGPTSYSANDNFDTMLGKATRLLLGRHQYAGSNITTPGLAAFQFLATGRVGQYDSGGGVYVDRTRQTAIWYRLQFWSSVISGVSGMMHFSHYFPASGPTIVDDTDTAVAAAIADAVAKIAILENQGGVNVLMDTVSGGRRAFTERLCCKTTGGFGAHDPNNFDGLSDMFVAPVGNEMPAWFQGCEIAAAGDTYRLVVNLSPTTTKSLTDAAWGLTSNSFAPGQVKCFKASAPTVDIFA